MNNRFSSTFTTLATTTITSGVRRSDTPRSQPCPASAISANGSPSEPIRRYVVARSPVCPSPPSSATSGAASPASTAASTTPIPVDSQSACAAILPAASTSPAPWRRATAAVVP